MYSSSLLQEPLPKPRDTAAVDSPMMPSSGSVPAFHRPRSDEQGLSLLLDDTSTALRYVLERENAELKRQLALIVGERDEARRLIDAMRGIIS